MSACRDKAGTHAGVRRHRDANEKICDECRKFRSEYSKRNYRANRDAGVPLKIRPRTKCKYGHDLVRKVRSRQQCVECHQFNPDKCGTTTGAKRHERYGVPYCEPCKLAKREDRRKYGRRTPRATKAAVAPKKDYWYEEYQELKDMGWSFYEICRALKISEIALRDRLRQRELRAQMMEAS